MNKRLPAHPIDLAILGTAAGAVALAQLLRVVLVAVVALVLVLAGYRPSPAAPAAVAALPPAAPAPAAPVARDWAGRPLTVLPVKELRQLARAAGHRALARSGRRADLLAVLA